MEPREQVDQIREAFEREFERFADFKADGVELPVAEDNAASSLQRAKDQAHRQEIADRRCNEAGRQGCRRRTARIRQVRPGGENVSIGEAIEGVEAAAEQT